MTCLVLANHFGRHHMTRLALRELLQAPSKDLQTPINIMVTSGLISHLLQLRQARLEKMRNRIIQVEDYITSVPGCGNGHWGVLHSIVKLVFELQDEPSWRTLQRNVNSWRECNHAIKFGNVGMLGTTRCILSPADLFNVWKPKLLAEESELPELPSSLL
ncbi:hypothetical protein FRB91_003879 [Serendipita sp. 411]|nr:hypothetical protein FRB91_003879 [Serendipita sp. 411]